MNIQNISIHISDEKNTELQHFDYSQGYFDSTGELVSQIVWCILKSSFFLALLNKN
jgi:hypothetical protein